MTPDDVAVAINFCGKDQCVGIHRNEIPFALFFFKSPLPDIEGIDKDWLEQRRCDSEIVTIAHKHSDNAVMIGGNHSNFMLETTNIQFIEVFDVVERLKKNWKEQSLENKKPEDDYYG